ncbi:hypothetical protein IPM62_00500 [Candidatus Woesebacteria bacterium]|nr:MAG: hypothetical protein IPM62_00500 [Candidatus Woesebacteria bacterium]
MQIKSYRLLRKPLFTTLFILCSLFFLVEVISVTASNCDSANYDCQIAEIQREIDALRPAQEYNKKELGDLRNQVKSLESRINNLSVQLSDLNISILKREEDLAYTKEIFEEKTHNHYKLLRVYDPVLSFLSSKEASEALREMNFRKIAAEEDRSSIEKYAEDLVNLKNDREELKKNQENLASAKAQVAKRAEFLEGEVEATESHLANLSSKQESLKALKEGGFQTSIGNTPPTLEPCSGPAGSSNYCAPGFSPAFAAFSFGAPHRVGMSQYGAYGRSKSGQSAEQILAAYFSGADLTKGFAASSTINVDGYGTISLEDNYLLGIYEVPESWGDSGGLEALKAQAVAARSYALAVTNNGAGSICTTESCQVYKPQLKSGKWAEAVRATRGWVLTKGGVPAKAYYSSTTGGYTISQWGWNGIKDTSGAWPETAYEKISGSPWFYKGWYKSRGGASCGRGNPWLTSNEMADILNAWHVLYKGGGDAGRISPLDVSCWGGNPYSQSDLVGIGGYTSVSGVSVVYSNSGFTQSVTFGTNKGSVSMTGEELKRAFNLRAPGYIGIKSSLFNIEKI